MLFFAVGLLSVFTGVRTIALEPSLTARADAFQSEIYAITDASGDENDLRDHSADYLSAYREWFPDGVIASLEGANEDELSNLFKTYYNYLIASGQRTGVSELEAIFHTMEAMGWADERTIELMHRLYLTFRLFDDAEAFRESHAEFKLAAPPPISPSKPADSGRIVLTPSEDGSVLVRQSIDLSSNKVVIIGHPHCHFSRNAMADIADDPELADSLQSNAVWLAETFASLTDGAIVEWNRAHPAQKFRYVASESDWPEINYWGTPSFYFFKNGRLVKKVIGWPNDIDGRNERKAALKAGLAAIGVDQ